VLVVALVLALYGRALGFGFIVDDHALVANNAALADWSTLGQALGHDLFHFADVRASPYWRPLVTLSYYVDHAVGGGQPWAFHLTNLLWLMVAGVGVARLAPGWSGVALALAFVAHPLQVEGAVSIASRTDLMCVACMIWALRVRHIPATVLTVAACLSKEVGLLLPFVLFLDRRRWQGPAVAAGLVLVIRALVPLGAMDSSADVLAAPGRMAWMATRLVVPTFEGLSTEGLVLPLPLAVLVLVGVGATARLHRAAPVLVLGPLFAVSGVLGIARTSDALLLVPLLGLVLVVAPRARVVPLLVLSALAAVVSGSRVGEWRDDLSLWEATHQANPDEVQPRLGIARAVVDEDPERALSLLQVEGRTPRESREVAEVRGRALLVLGRNEEAVVQLRRAAWDDPEATWANAVLCGLTTEVGICTQASTLAPDEGGVWNSLGIAHAVAGSPEDALVAFEAACALADEYCANAAQARSEVELAPGGEGGSP
jgi:hypothetical protein